MFSLISQRQIINSYGIPCDSLEKNYLDFYNKLKLRLIPVSNFQTPEFYDAKLLILTGGGNIYGEQSERDIVEAKLFKKAISNKTPIIAICRGMQYVNILLGGKISNLDSLKVQRFIGVDHKVYIKDKALFVNNYHNYGIFKDDLADQLNVFAIDKENNVIEAFYSNKMKILGIQWHPERSFSDENSYKISEQIIKDFINNNGEINESDYTCGR